MKLVNLAKALRLNNPETATEEEVVAAIGNVVYAHDAMVEQLNDLKARIRAGEFRNYDESNALALAAFSPDARPPENPAKRHPAGSGTKGPDASSAENSPFPLDNGDLDAIYAYVKQRAAKDPGVLQILQQQPELRVKVDRVTIEVDGATVRGQLAILITKGFFDSAQNGNAAFNELKRLGRPCAKPNVYRELDKLAEMGFVTKEDAGYQAVKAMKVNIAGAGR